MNLTELAGVKPVQPPKFKISLFSIVGQAAAVLWRAWPKDMECKRDSSEIGGARKYILTGRCPFFRHDATFKQVSELHVEETDDEGYSQSTYDASALFVCPRCKKCILGIVLETQTRHYHEGDPYMSYEGRYKEHYPLAMPDDSYDEGIPSDIGDCLSEALRCRSVNAFNATVEMCRRALEASCLELQADPSLNLKEKIDWVFSQGKIIASLKEWANHIRLAGNRGAHPPEDPSESQQLDEHDADAVIEFTREYLHDVYVMPYLSSQFDFSRAGMKRKAEQQP